MKQLVGKFFLCCSTKTLVRLRQCLQPEGLQAPANTETRRDTHTYITDFQKRLVGNKFGGEKGWWGKNYGGFGGSRKKLVGIYPTILFTL